MSEKGKSARRSDMEIKTRTMSACCGLASAAVNDPYTARWSGRAFRHLGGRATAARHWQRPVLWVHGSICGCGCGGSSPSINSHLSASPCWHWQRPPPPDPHAPCPTLHQPLPGTGGFWIGLTLMLLQHLRRMLLVRARLHASIILANNGTSSQTAGSASEWPSLDAKTRAFVMCSLPRQKVRVLSSFLEKCWDSFVGTLFSAGVEQIMSITC
jgi:hypothetical protein